MQTLAAPLHHADCAAAEAASPAARHDVAIALFDEVELLDFAGPYEVFTTPPACMPAGISAGIDMSLHLVSRLAGIDLAAATARQMDYRWAPE